jgi:hypothetical protein
MQVVLLALGNFPRFSFNRPVGVCDTLANASALVYFPDSLFARLVAPGEGALECKSYCEPKETFPDSVSIAPLPPAKAPLDASRTPMPSTLARAGYQEVPPGAEMRSKMQATAPRSLAPQHFCNAHTVPGGQPQAGASEAPHRASPFHPTLG